MVLHKNSGYHVPPIPQVPKSAKGKRSVRKKAVDNQMCAFDLLAAVAGKLFLERESSSAPNKIIGTPNDSIKEEHIYDEKPVKDKTCDLGSSNKNALGRHLATQGQVTSGPANVLLKSDSSNREVSTKKKSPYIDKTYEGKVIGSTLVGRKASTPGCLEDKMDVDDKPHALVCLSKSFKAPHYGDHNFHNTFSSQCWDEKRLVVRDDDENSSGRIQPSITARTVKHQGLGHRMIRKQLATKFCKVATTMAKDRELSNADVEMSPSFHSRKISYTRQRIKRRKLFHYYYSNSFERTSNRKNRLSPSSLNGQLTSNGSEDLHVKLRIKSFKVPELFIEISETSTVGSLKRTVMEAVTAILGGGLRVDVLFQGKKVRDDNKPLVQAGISHGDKLDDLDFTLEPKSTQASPLLICPLEPRLLLPIDAAQPPANKLDMVPMSDGGTDIRPELPLTPNGNYMESHYDLVHSPADTLSIDKTAEDVHPLIAIPSMSVELLPMVPVRKPRQSDIVQRRIRRPFSVSEVEALVQAVEKLGTGRWRDVKIRAFDNAKHRTYVDLKDKWKTLVHTARISPQQRRGEPVPQELLDRVLSAHAYWAQQQAKLQDKSGPTEARLLI